MDNKTRVDTFKYFVEEYMYNLNGGGTYSFKELVEEFKKSESINTVDKLISEAKYLKEVLIMEDWEIEKKLLDYLLKTDGKSKWVKRIDCLLEIL